MNSIRILIVEDEVQLANLIKTGLQQLEKKYVISVVNSGIEAYELIKKQTFDIMVTDIRMQGLTGIELMKSAVKIQQDLQTIVITGHGDLDNAIEALRSGAINFILKPISYTALHYAIQKGFDQLTLIRKLRENEDRFRSTFYHTAAGMVIIQPDGEISQVNTSFCEITGYSQNELRGKSLFALVHENDLKKSSKHIEELLSGEVEYFHLNSRFIHKDGDTIWATISVSSVPDDEGKPKYLMVQLLDITEHIKAEEQLRQSQKMETIGQLAGGVAHDFNNILTGIIGFADLATDSIMADNPAKGYLDAIIKRSDDAAYLVRQLLAFGRKQMLDIKQIDLNRIITQSSEFLAKIFRDDISISTDLSSNLIKIDADPTAIQQILTNLCLNSQAALPDGGKITLKTKNIIITEEFLAKFPGAKTTDHILLSVVDNGIGMSEHVLEHIYEPFFTTKEVGEGTGLGLSMVYGLMEQHNGQLDCQSELGQGTTFDLYFPLSSEGPSQESFHDDGHLVTGSEAVLIVEDDMDVLTILKNILERSGYTVLVAVNGQEALKSISETDKNIALVITDIVMPGMSGLELYEKLRADYSDLKFLFISGYTSMGTERFKLKPQMEFLHKPFTGKQLNKKVRKILDIKAIDD